MKKAESTTLKPKEFSGKKLSRTPAIVSDEIEETPILSDNIIKKHIDHEEEINIQLNPKVCCPELVGTSLSVDAAFTNDKCGKPVATVPEDSGRNMPN